MGDKRTDVLTFSEAEALGGEVFDRWVGSAGVDSDWSPFAREDYAWADIVQFVLRRSRDVVAAREAAVADAVRDADVSRPMSGR